MKSDKDITTIKRVKFFETQCRCALDLTVPEGWKAELIWVIGYIPRWFTCLQTVTHPGTNRTWCRAIMSVGPMC